MSTGQPLGADKCFLCGATEVSPEAHYGSPVCDDCLPIREHVVSMQTGDGGSSLAVCRCGWRSEIQGGGRYIVQDTKVRLHWRGVIARAKAEAALAEQAA